MQFCQGVVVFSVYYLLVTNQVTFGYPAGEHVAHGRSHLTPDDLERKRIYERSPSHTTYEFLTQYYSFICHNKEPGYYGDPHYECRIFHVCQPDGRRDTFFCPAWTRFNNNVQICDWQYKVNDYCNARHTPHTETTHLPRNSYLLQQQTVQTRLEAPPPDPYPPAEPDRYRNKYEQQEYYKSIYDQEPKLKFLMDDRPAVLYPKRTLLYLPQPVFTHVNAEIPADVAVSLQEDNPGNTLTAKEIPVEVVQVVEETTPSGLEDPSQYESGARDHPSHAIAVPPTTGYVVLQSPPEPHSGPAAGGGGGGGAHGGDHTGAEGHGTAHVPSPEGGGHPSEVDHAGVIDGPVIELWIPTPFKKAV